MESGYFDDAALSSLEQDKLNRENFIDQLFQSICSYPQRDCLVIGLLGGWGSGKTSVVNILKNRIKERNGAVPFADQEIGIIDYSPWGLADANSMTFHFFDELCQSISKMHNSKIAAKKIARAASEYIDSMSVLPEPMSEAARAGAALLRGISADGGRSPVRLKGKIQKLLSGTNRRYLVIIDDIDRLSDASIASLFQLIACVADFTNITYLLCFDDGVVSKALGAVQHGDGFEYLGKIIQVPVHIPQTNRIRLIDEMTTRLQDQVGAFTEEEASRYQALIVHDELFDFKSLRDVKRLANLFLFRYSGLKRDLDPVDMLALCAIEISKPDLYEWIAKHPYELTNGRPYTFRSNDDWEDEIRQRLARLAPDERLDEYFKAAQLLFPSFCHDLTYIPSSNDDCSKRIINESAFPNYFLLWVTPETLSADEVDLIHESMRNGSWGLMLDEYYEAGRGLLLLTFINNELARVDAGVLKAEYALEAFLVALLHRLRFMRDRSEKGSLVPIVKAEEALSRVSILLGEVRREQVIVEQIASMSVEDCNLLALFLLHQCQSDPIYTGQAFFSPDMTARLVQAIVERLPFESPFDIERSEQLLQSGTGINWIMRAWQTTNEASYEGFWEAVRTQSALPFSHIALASVVYVADERWQGWERAELFTKHTIRESTIVDAIEGESREESFWMLPEHTQLSIAAYANRPDPDLNFIPYKAGRSKLDEWLERRRLAAQKHED